MHRRQIEVVSRDKKSASANVATSTYEQEKVWVIVGCEPALPGMKIWLADEACGRFR